MLFNLLTNVIVWVYDTIKFFISIPDYRISDQLLEYEVDNSIVPEIEDNFWKDEISKWDDISEMHFKDLNGVAYRNVAVPNNIPKTLVRVKYWYNDKIYKFLTYDMNHEWPPNSGSTMSFSIPLVSAHLLDQDDKPQQDILNKIKRYAGPRGDFHGEDVLVSDMLYYDKETLQESFPKIKLVSAIGTHKVINTSGSKITDLRIP